MTGRWLRFLPATAKGAACAVLALALPGCAVLRMSPGSMAQDLAASIQRQSDPDLVRDGAPSCLLILDGLAESSPRDTGVLLAAANARVAYASAFLRKEEQDRAAAMYAKARDYGLAVLSQDKVFRTVRDRPLSEFETAMARFSRRDVPALFVTAEAWIGCIASKSSSMEAMADLPKAMALVRRVLELDPSYQQGGADLFMGIYFALQPAGGGRDLPRSRGHFERAFALAGPDYLPSRVAFAEFYARYAFDRALFENTLKGVLDHTTQSPDFNLANEVARRRARELLEHADDLF
jgi:hypothetical protein